MITTWTCNNRTSITFSHENPGRAEAALDDALRALEAYNYGCDIRSGYGIWQGTRERSHTLTVVDMAHPDESGALAALVSAVTARGCEAIQVERWEDGDYECREVRDATDEQANAFYSGGLTPEARQRAGMPPARAIVDASDLDGTSLFTVIGTYADNGQRWAKCVEAVDASDAIGLALCAAAHANECDIDEAPEIVIAGVVAGNVDVIA